MPRQTHKPKRQIPAPAAAYQEMTTKEHLYEIAVDMYCDEQELARGPKTSYVPCGLRKIAIRVSDIHYEETGERINLSYATLGRRVRGERSCRAFVMDKMWLSPPEEDEVVRFILEMAGRAFPLSHRRVKEHVDKICHSKYPQGEFPETGVGRNWTYRFLLCHFDELRIARSSPLETKRGKAVTPEANEAWWDLLKGVLDKYDVKPHNIYGADECGIMNRGAEREKVFGPRDQKGPVYQAKGGNRDNTTVLVTICADGTYTAPTIIFKGQAFQSSWLSVTELKPNVGYQVKGWTNGEIGAAWMKIFDEETKVKLTSPDEYRLLLVDGHNSHHTVDFLQYARDHNIIVVCYIPHGTHVYQGLDVVIFGPLKTHLGKERNQWLREENLEMSCKTFIKIFSRSFLETLTPHLIKTAFRKTGVHPFDPSQIDPSKVTPSKETNPTQRGLPAQTPLLPALDELATLINALTINKPSPNVASGSSSLNSRLEQLPPSSPSSPSSLSGTPPPPTSSNPNNPNHIIQATTIALQNTNMAYLFDASTRITTSHPLPPQINITDIPTTTPHPFSGTFTPTTAEGMALFAALRMCKGQLHDTNKRLVALHAAHILNHNYTNRIHNQLGESERKAKKKEEGNTRFMIKGATVLTNDAVIEHVKQRDAAKKAEIMKKAKRDTAKTRHAEAIKKWEDGKEAIKADNAKRKEQYKEAVAKWEQDRATAKAKKVRFRTLRPKQGPLKTTPPRPLLKDFLNEADAKDEEDSSGGDEDAKDEDRGSEEEEETGDDDD